MSIEASEYVEWGTDVSLDEDKPVSYFKFTRSKESQKESISVSPSRVSVQPRSQNMSGSTSSFKSVWICKTCQRCSGPFLRDHG